MPGFESIDFLIFSSVIAGVVLVSASIVSLMALEEVSDEDV